MPSEKSLVYTNFSVKYTIDANLIPVKEMNENVFLFEEKNNNTDMDRNESGRVQQ